MNGAVFHNFLLLQKKGTDLLNSLEYPTIQKLCMAAKKSRDTTIQSTQEALVYLATLREQFCKNVLSLKQLPNEARIEEAGQALLNLIPTKPITSAINEADFQIIPQVNQFLEIFQNEYNAALKTIKGTPTQIKHLENNYETLLNGHIKEIKNISYLLQKNLSFLIEAHAMLNDHLFEYVYRFAKASPQRWSLYFQKKNDLYLLVPKDIYCPGINKKELKPIDWESSSENLKMITDHAASAQGLYSLYQRDFINPLENIDHFFILKDQLYIHPLDLFIVGHGDTQTSVEEYVNQMNIMEQNIKKTISTLQILKNNCEVQLTELLEKPLNEVIIQLTTPDKLPHSTYKIMAKGLNKKFIDELHRKNKNPLKPNSIEVENFLIKEYNRLNQNEVELSFFWTFVCNLELIYQKAADAINSSKNKNEEAQLAQESAHISGLTTSQLTSFIEKSAKEKRIKTAYFFTCFGGGANRLIFEKLAQKLNADEPASVDLAIGALTDASVPSLIPTLAMFNIDEDAQVSFTPPLSFKTFFEKKVSLEGLEAITVGQKYSPTSNIQEYFHGVADFPWKYNHQTERFELINLRGLVLDLTEEKLKSIEKEKTSLTVVREKVIMVHQPTNEISLTLKPKDRLLPLLVSSQTEQVARFSLKELKLPDYTLQELLNTSIGHLRQSKEYEINIDSLICHGITKRNKELLALDNVRITSKIIPDKTYETEKEKPAETGIIFWDLFITQGGHSSHYRCKDFYNKENQRIFTTLLLQ